jgi:hypothetical protein
MITLQRFAAHLLFAVGIAAGATHAMASTETQTAVPELFQPTEQLWSAADSRREADATFAAANSSVCRICPAGYHCHCDPKTGTCWCIVKQPK